MGAEFSEQLLVVAWCLVCGMARITFVLSCLVVAGIFVSVDAGCEYYENCGACVADAGCGWCSNDPKGIGTGIMSSDGGANTDVTIETNEGTDSGLDLSTADAGPKANDLVAVGGQYREVTSISGTKATLSANFEWRASGYVASPYFGHTTSDTSRGYGIVGVHKTRFLAEISAGNTITPYMKDTYTVQSVQSDTMVTLDSSITSTFSNIEYQIGHYKVSGSISYPDTSKTTLYGSHAPSPTKFTTELKDGYVISTGSDEHSDSNSPARVGQVINDHTVILSSKFIQTFDNEPLWVEMGGPGTGLISGTAGQAKMSGSDPCATGYPCHPPTAFLSELRVGDLIEITDTDSGGNTRQRLRSVAAIQDDNHLQINECLAGDYEGQSYFTDGSLNCIGMPDSVDPLSGTTHGDANAIYGKLGEYATFAIRSIRSAAYTNTRKVTGQVINDYEGDAINTDIEISVANMGAGTPSLTKVIGENYAVIVQVTPAVSASDGVNDGTPAVYERRMVKKVIGKDKFTIDNKFSKLFSGTTDGKNEFYYESCPSLTYENYDDRTENGPGVISGTGASYTYDNTPYAEVTSTDAAFATNVNVGYEIVLRNTGVKRRVTKVVSDTKIHINRPFNEYVNSAPVGFSQHAWQYVVKKGYDKNPKKEHAYGSDYHHHWKPAYNTGGQNSRQQKSIQWDANGFSDQIYAHQMMSSTTTSGATITMQDPYLLVAPVCYNNGRCVPKTSHSLVGVESKLVNADGSARKGSIMSSSTSNYVHDLVNTGDTSPFYKDCKPTCTITAEYAGVFETRQVVGTVTAHNSTHLYTELPFTYNGTQSQYDNDNVPGFVPAGTTAFNAMTDVEFRVRYVTATGTVHWCPNGEVNSNNADGEICHGNTLTGASKETKTKFHSETSPQWTITVPCTSDSSETRENRTISQIMSDTKLVVHETFTASNNKVSYCIGNIPALGRVTNPQGHTKVYGDDDTRFLEQLKVGYEVTVGNYKRSITSITSNSEMTVNKPFTNGINTKSAMYFHGKTGTGEVSTSAGSTDVIGTLDVTATKFNEELALGYMIMVGGDYKVITGISSASKLSVDLPFDFMTHSVLGTTYGYYKNSLNYESCFTNQIGLFADSNEYTGKHVYVEDACEIKPGCCGFKLTSSVQPDRFAYYKIRPPHSNTNIRVVVTTIEDNVDLLVKKDAVPTTSSYDYTSVRESNPWAISIPHSDITCGEAYVGYNVSTTLGDQPHITSPLAGDGLADDTRTFDADAVDLTADDTFAPSNCSYFYIGVRGDNRYPQKTGASEYNLVVFTEFEFPNFLCADASSDTTAADGQNACHNLGLTTVEDANFMLNTDDDRAVMRLTPAENMRKGAMWYSTKVHIYHGFETTFQFRMAHFTVGCNSVKHPSGFCGGGDGLAFLIHDDKDGDKDIGCYGGALGFGTITAADQGDDWARPRCLTYDQTTAASLYAQVDEVASDGRAKYYHRCDSGCLPGVSNANLKDCNAIAGSTESGTWGNNPDVNANTGASDGHENGAGSTRMSQDDGLFQETCALMALCDPLNNGCGGTCGMPDCSQAIGRVVGVEFDTWNNLNLHDPKQGVSRWWINATEFIGYNDNHLAVFSSDSTIGTSTDHASPNHFGATPSIPNLADGKNHTVKIKYWPQEASYTRARKKDRGQPHTTGITTHGDCQDNTGASDASTRNAAPDACVPVAFTNSAPGNLAIFIDDMKKPVLQVKISLRMGDAAGDCHDNDIDRCILDTQGNAYVGFSASTGGERIGVTYDTDPEGITSTLHQAADNTAVMAYIAGNGQTNAAYETAVMKVGAAQTHEILSWKFCNMIGCVAA